MSRWTQADVARLKAPGGISVLPTKETRSKYGNTKTRGFASKHEANCARELELRVLAGEINHLRYQARFELIPTQRDESGKLLERSVAYVADFVFEEGGKEIIADAKGCRNPGYILKRKMMMFLKGIRIREL